MVKLIKIGDNQPVTAAIGDGANDVSMIQEADVGLGQYQGVQCRMGLVVNF